MLDDARDFASTFRSFGFFRGIFLSTSFEGLEESELTQLFLPSLAFLLTFKRLLLLFELDWFYETLALRLDLLADSDSDEESL